MKEPNGVSYTHVKFEIDSFLGLATALIQSEKNVFFERFLAILGPRFVKRMGWGTPSGEWLCSTL